MNFGFIIDNRKCIGCHACTVACKAEHDVPIGVNRTWVKYIEKGEFPNSRRIFSVMRCNHCTNAPCVEICPVSALFIREDGIVDFDNRRCIGCKACTQACPYDALYIDPDLHTAAKCNYCAHRIDVGLEPACVNVCPEHAIISGDMENPFSEISQLLSSELVQVRKPEKGTLPKLFYIGGDDASLRPLAAQPAGQYLWSQQTGGVGHHASELVDKTEFSPVPEPTFKPSAGAENGSPASEAPEKVRRVYDAPSKGVMWGWEVYAYILTKALAAGAFILPFFLQISGVAVVPDSVQWASVFISLGFLGVTGVLLVMDLDKPTRFLYVLLRPHWSSWLVKGAYYITAYGAVLALWIVAKLLHWQAIVTPLIVLGIVLGCLTAIYTAFLFAQAKGRDFWQNPTLPYHMLIHTAIAGASLFLLLGVFQMQFSMLNGPMRSVLIVALIVHLFAMWAELSTEHSSSDSREVERLVHHGRFKKQYWGAVVAIGSILPLILLIWFPSVLINALAGVLAFVGLWYSVKIWVLAPQAIPLR